MAKKNIFIIGLDLLNLQEMQHVLDADQYEFHELLDFEAVKKGGGPSYPFNAVLEQAEQQLNAFNGTIDAIVGYWDFPVTTMVPILAERFGTTAPTLTSVVKCEHKYWSRLVQREVIDELPAFEAFNPFDEDPLRHLEQVRFPMWIKPIKATASVLGYKIENEQQFNHALNEIREEIPRIARGFNEVLAYVDLPESIAHVDGHYCLAESIISGSQCTVNGYVSRGEVMVYGVIDSINFAGTSSFQRYEYPSTLADAVQQRLIDISIRVIRHIGLNESTFNIEFFYDEEGDRIGLLEINPRMSQSHGNIFEKVEGLPDHELLIDLALGQPPKWERGAGPHDKAAKFFMRSFEADAYVKRVPTEEEITAIRQEMPDARIQILPEEGQRLSDMIEQEPYSYELAYIFLGADSQAALLEKYERIVDRLTFDLEPIDPTAKR